MEPHHPFASLRSEAVSVLLLETRARRGGNVMKMARCPRLLQ